MKQILYRVAAVGVYLAVLLGGILPARADVGLVLNSSMGTGSSFVTSGGHASIYLSRICPVTAVEVRLCAPGEQGSVLSNYSNFHEDKPYEWNIIPVSVFLYGVEDPANRPLYATPALQTTLRQQYLKARLGQLCATEDCRTNPDANWQDMVGAAFLRTIYIFEVKTTEAQDLEIIRQLNESENVNHYHGLSNNCADFVKNILNSYFPHAIQSHRFADFYITSPKTTARSLVHYAERHPELQIRVTRFAQLPSAIRRSDPARSGMETVFTTKKSLLPMLFRPEELGVIAGIYLLTDRFSAERASRRHAADPELEEIQLAESRQDAAAGVELASFPIKSGAVTNASAAGSAVSASMRASRSATWADYKTWLVGQESDARAAGVIADDAELAGAFRQMGKLGVPRLDDSGRPWMDMAVEDNGAITNAELGLTPAAVKQSSNEESARLAYKYQLARVRFYLHSKGMDREGLREFSQDWALLEAARNSLAQERYRAAAAVPTQDRPNPPDPLSESESSAMATVSLVRASR
jgi:hypothetical protein